MNPRTKMQFHPRGKTTYVDKELDWGVYLLKLGYYFHVEQIRVYPSYAPRIEDLNREYSLLASFKDYDDAIDFKNKKLKNYEEYKNFEKYTFLEVKQIEKKGEINDKTNK